VVLVDFLHAIADIFAWISSDMPGIPREVLGVNSYAFLMPISGTTK
jgi:hypothetical protein